MRTLLHRVWKTAEEALQRVMALEAGGQVIPPPLPVATQTVFVNKGGNDGTGTGTIESPYLTLTKAMASITDSSIAKQYSIQTGPGSYVLPPMMKGGVSITAIDPAETFLTGALVLDPGFTAQGNIFALANVTVNDPQALHFGAFGGLPGFELYNVAFGGNFAVDGSVGGWAAYIVQTQMINFDPTDAQDIESFGLVVDGSVVATATNNAGVWNSHGDTFANNAVVVATAGFNFTIKAITTQTNGGLTINGVNAFFRATAGGIPPAVGFLGGATAAQITLLSAANGLGYIPVSLPNWSGIGPSSTANALDRLAAHVGPVP